MSQETGGLNQESEAPWPVTQETGSLVPGVRLAPIEVSGEPLIRFQEWGMQQGAVTKG